VKLPQMAPMEALEGEYDELPPEAKAPIKPIDKIIVAFAGPLFSFLLALTMASIVWMVGRPDSEFDKPTIGYVKAGGPADLSGLKVGDDILEVDGKKVSHFVSGTNSVKWAIVRSEGEKIPFKVRRDGHEVMVYSSWAKEEKGGWRRPALREVAIGPKLLPGIGIVQRNTPAAQAGLQANDLIVEAGGKPVADLEGVSQALIDAKGQALPMVVQRNGARVSLSLNVPSAESGAPNLGIEWGRIEMMHPGPWEQVSDAATSIFRMVGALFSWKSDVKPAHFSGPAGIMRLYYMVLESPDGWRRALALSVLINVNLAMINLLPLPVLDGGHITLAILEGVRRKPINARILEIIQTACAVLIIGFMLFVTFYDVGDFIGEKKDEARAAASTPAAEKK